MLDLRGKVAVVTGANRGLGRGLAIGLARSGAAVAVTARSMEADHPVVQEIIAAGGEALGLRCDVSSKPQVDEMVEQVIAHWGKVDVLVNNAGVLPFIAKPEDIRESGLDKAYAINVKGPFLCAQAVARSMIPRRAGKIINLASAASVKAAPNLLPYNVTKAAVVQLTRSLALDWAQHNIQVNALAPGYMDEGMGGRTIEQAPEIARIIESEIPAGRFGRIDELLGLLVFLASDASSYVTGQLIHVDGGFTAR